jgi:hypothetical protein
MKKNILCSFFIIITISLFAQTPPDTTWTRTYGGGQYEWGRMVQQTNDGGYIILGETLSFGAGHYDIWLIKTDCNGIIEWDETYGGLDEDRGCSVQQTNDNGYIIGGTTASYGMGIYDFWLIKTDVNGNVEWENTFGGIGWEWGFFVQQTNDNGYIMVGASDPTGMGIFDVLLIKTDRAGNQDWTQTFGGNSADYGTCVQQTSDGGYIIVGDTYSFGAGSRDIWLIKTDESGNEHWTNTFGGSDSDRGNCVRQTLDDGFIITGYTKSFGAGDDDVWLIKTNNSGNIDWTNTFGGSNSDGGECVQQTFDGGYIIVGYTESFGAGSSDMWLVKTNSNGETLWTKTIGGEDYDWGRCVQQTNDYGYIIVGEDYSFFAGEYNIRLIKIESENVEASMIPRPDNFNLHHYPNPFNPSTTISFNLTAEEAENTELVIYNVKGQKVKTLVNEYLEAGNHTFLWNGTDKNGKPVSSGIYFYKLKSSNYNNTKKMLLLK